jgi:hypothetical protein
MNLPREYVLELSKMTEHKVDTINEPELSLEYVNARIKKEVCYEAIGELTDANLMCAYKDCQSVKNRIQKLGDVLDKHIDDEKKQNIIDDYLVQLIPPGTKGFVRGNKFNCTVKDHITRLALDKGRFEICFERKCDSHFTVETPNWYILEKSTNKIIIGMNQVDLWSGGHQLFRGASFIGNDKHNNSYSKLLCVICREIQFKRKNKTFKLIQAGFKNDTVCYLNNLRHVITSYFNILTED